MTKNYRWLDPRGLGHGSWPARGGRLLLILITLVLAGFPVYNTDVFLYPSHIDTYIERYFEFIIDPFGDNFFHTKIEIIGGNWQRSLRLEEFDGKYWIFKEDLTKNGSGTNILDPDLPPGLADDTGEAAAGQRRVRSKTEVYEIQIRDLRSGQEYAVNDYVGFYRYSDREYCSKPVNEKNYQAILSLKGPWKADLLAFREQPGNSLIVFRLFVSDELFEQISRWPE